MKEESGERIREDAVVKERVTVIDIARAAPVGGMQGWRPAMPVTQWSWVKKAETNKD